MQTKPDDLVIICWHNTADGQEGEGTMPIPKSTADKLIQEMEKKYPYVTHWTKAAICPNS